MKRLHAARVRRDEDGTLTAIGSPAISTRSGLEQWWLDGRLHRPDGPAVSTQSGTKLYFWRGINVPRHIIEDPRATPPEEILEEPNAEVRRAWLESYGLEDAILDLARDGKARMVDQEQAPARRLWEICTRDVDGNPPVYVEVTCPSTDRRYFLRVPPDMRTCHQAVAWTFGETEYSYQPVDET